MGWLRYSEDELRRFHPEFESAANDALQVAGHDGTHEWVHHPRVSGGTVIPDFVLRRKAGNQWVLAFEVKRTRSAVYSTRFQVQAKGYAEGYQYQYAPAAPRYFALSNLEVTMLFALNGNRPTVECRLAQPDSVFESGDFSTDPEADHRLCFVADIARIIDIVITGRPPVFDVVWPGVLSDFVSHVEALLGLAPTVGSVTTGIGITEPATPDWPLVRDYFGAPPLVDSARVFLLRCLMVEYLRGTLLKHGHSMSKRIPRLRSDRVQASVANAIDALRTVDFLTMFEDSAADAYRALSDPNARDVLIDYVGLLLDPKRGVSEAARTRVDSPLLVDSLMSTIHPLESQDERGKISTDPDLATLLAYLAIPLRGSHGATTKAEAKNDAPYPVVLDPCCGDGALLSAAYDRLLDLGSTHEEAVASLSGIEADPVATRLACVRLALKQPASLGPDPPIGVSQADMFASASTLAEADVVLMNPPFRRYEAQDGRPVPPALRTHYEQAIQDLDGIPPSTMGRQANLFNAYVEYVAKATSEGTRVAVVLDNKWHHNGYGYPLRKLLLERFEIEGIVEYPRYGFFSAFTIATSILVARRTDDPDPAHEVKFVRCEGDPRGADLVTVAEAFQRGGGWPHDWISRERAQSSLDAKDGWKSHFSADLENDFRRAGWPTLDELFESARRGSLNKEEGGIGVLEFPFGRADFGKRRSFKPPPRKRPFQTLIERPLTASENKRLASLAENIPDNFRGLAVKNSDHLHGYELTDADVENQQTLEPPHLRSKPSLFTGERRSGWTADHDAALSDMRADPDVGAFIAEIEVTTNMTERVLPREQLWVALREPFAGELIVPRKTRKGHRVHVNPYALASGGRKVRVSSNFVSYKGCLATHSGSGLGRAEAVRLIAAFLISSFGQLQFEIEGANREGLLSLEKEQLARVRVFDPRWVKPAKRQPILDAFSRLPYPISTDRLSLSQPERNDLDKLFAEEIATKHPGFDADVLLAEAHDALDEWLEARQP